MNVYFNFQKTKKVNESLESLKKRILRDTVLKCEAFRRDAIFIGKFKDDRLFLKRCSMFWNAFRPIAILKFTHDAKGREIVKIKYILGSKCYLFLLVGLFICAYAFIQTKSYAFMVPAILWIFFWYIFGFLLYYFDYRITKRKIESYFK
jgi:hypothetical protein